MIFENGPVKRVLRGNWNAYELCLESCNAGFLGFPRPTECIGGHPGNTDTSFRTVGQVVNFDFRVSYCMLNYDRLKGPLSTSESQQITDISPKKYHLLREKFCRKRLLKLVK
jgi:hypothetical protein